MNKLNLEIDFSAICRSLKKYVGILLMCSVIFGTTTYMVVDHFVPVTYTVNVNFSVLGSETNASTYALRLLRSAVIRYVGLLNSDAMKQEITRQLGSDELPGNVEADYIYGSNIITAQCTATSPAQAMQIARTVRNSYRTVTKHVKGAYSVRAISMDEARYITASTNMAILLALLLAALLFVAGMAIVIFLQVFNGKVQNLKQAENSVDTRLIGNVLHEKKNDKKNMLVTNPSVSFAYVESVQKVALGVMRELESRHHKVLMVTSVLENEGKSTTAANIALVLAQRGKKVLLIDADLRKAALYKLFDIRKQDGMLKEYLEGSVTLEQAITRDERTGLYFSYTGHSCEDADALLENGALHKLLDYARAEMDYVIVDCSPAGITRDSAVISGMAEECLMVVRTETARLTAVNDTIEELEDGNVRMLGFVLNDDYGKSAQTVRKYGYNKYYSA